MMDQVFKTRTMVTLMIVVCVCAAGVWTTGTHAEEPASAKDRLAQLAWFKGHWATTADGNPLEEYWSAPLADSMVGAFRWFKEGKLWMTEFLNITVEGDDVIFRLKHFDRKMVGWEEKDKAINMKLTHVASDEAVFEETVEKEKLRITYQRDGENGMNVLLERMRDGKLERDTFQFKRGS